MIVPERVCTSRLLLRPWRAEDAPSLLPVLESNQPHLTPWIPPRVSEPVAAPLLARRLAAFGADFAAAREWRYGLFTPAEDEVIGEVGLYPRNAERRVPHSEADRVEVGYWLRSDLTGRGLATEAVQAVLAIAHTLRGITLIEIRCDARNTPSAAVPRRLGFKLAETLEERSGTPEAPPIALQVWTYNHGHHQADDHALHDHRTLPE
jgi:RimJ/RimL family protein N-acetyltransferase